MDKLGLMLRFLTAQKDEMRERKTWVEGLGCYLIFLTANGREYSRMEDLGCVFIWEPRKSRKDLLDYSDLGLRHSLGI
jgi:hypothetical protein